VDVEVVAPCCAAWLVGHVTGRTQVPVHTRSCCALLPLCSSSSLALEVVVVVVTTPRSQGYDAGSSWRRMPLLLGDPTALSPLLLLPPLLPLLPLPLLLP